MEIETQIGKVLKKILQQKQDQKSIQKLKKAILSNFSSINWRIQQLIIIQLNKISYHDNRLKLQVCSKFMTFISKNKIQMTLPKKNISIFISIKNLHQQLNKIYRQAKKPILISKQNEQFIERKIEQYENLIQKYEKLLQYMPYQVHQINTEKALFQHELNKRKILKNIGKIQNREEILEIEDEQGYCGPSYGTYFSKQNIQEDKCIKFLWYVTFFRLNSRFKKKIPFFMKIYCSVIGFLSLLFSILNDRTGFIILIVFLAIGAIIQILYELGNILEGLESWITKLLAKVSQPIKKIKEKVNEVIYQKQPPNNKQGKMEQQ